MGGWRALETAADGLGLLVVKPTRPGPSEITLAFDGGWEWRVTCVASGGVMLLVAGLGVAAWRRGGTAF